MTCVIPRRPPCLHRATRSADLIDELVRLNALGGPICGECQLRPTLLWRRDGDEVGTDPSAREPAPADALPARCARGTATDPVPRPQAHGRDAPARSRTPSARRRRAARPRVAEPRDECLRARHRADAGGSHRRARPHPRGVKRGLVATFLATLQVLAACSRVTACAFPNKSR